jgi:hypothetical protein
MSNPKQHACALLKYRDRYLELCETSQGNRWRLISQKHSYRKSDEDEVLLDDIVFCPGCGKDYRLDTTHKPAGRPQLQKILARIRSKARKEIAP